MKFKTKSGMIDKPEKYYSETGSPIKDVYTSRYDDKGEIIVEKTGETDFQAYIESFAESSSLEYLIAKYEMGDPDALNQVKGAYYDASNMPTSYAELFNMVNDAQEKFESLPVDIKDLYGNDPVKFFNEYGSPIFYEKIKKLDRYKVPKKESEVKTDVNTGTNE